MADRVSFAVVPARCEKTREGFGIRFEERRPRFWAATWAFRTDDRTSKLEGYESTKIEGSFDIDSAFPNCPRCTVKGLFQCGDCQKVSCGPRDLRRAVCGWCGNSGPISGSIRSLSTGEDSH